MYEWQRQIQQIVDEIDRCIMNQEDASLTLCHLSAKFGYSEFHMTRKFKEISGMSYREYLRKRRLAFALKEVRDQQDSILEIALRYGFSSHEAFTRAFKLLYGITPSAYRSHPRPVVLRTKINPFDRYFLGMDEIGTIHSPHRITTYFVSIPAHRFLYIENLESNGYWDFWQRQSNVQGQEYETICGLLDSIKDKMDDQGGWESDSGSGQIMAYQNNAKGRLCDWGYLRSECYGVRLSADYDGVLPAQMKLAEVPEGEYLVFEHGPFSYEQEKTTVEQAVEQEMQEFDYEETDYEVDLTEGRLLYFYFQPNRCWKYVKPVRKVR